uniref:C2H2-type domain-containing protein n=1 Tax=Strombidinopsis acuminata TaxID=141414 RepID=A0A7S3RCY8_9SPIT|mmetsp:Transcript_103066/g.142624  ORF Transcript_103066/g.142624 Transcript_103066/m.142624 type:complete len:136 (+) Transcript_103066:220-627(+)
MSEELSQAFYDYERAAVAALVGLCSSGSPTRRGKSGRPRLDSEGSSPSDSPRVIRRKESGSHPSGGAARFQCRYPGCSKMYASTDAVRKHCRKRHFEWLRRLDQLASHERQMSKPALYCRWSGAEGPGEVGSVAS